MVCTGISYLLCIWVLNVQFRYNYGCFNVSCDKPRILLLTMSMKFTISFPSSLTFTGYMSAGSSHLLYTSTVSWRQTQFRSWQESWTQVYICRTKCCSFCLFQLHPLRTVSHSLSVDAAKTLASAFISSRLDYCNSLPAGATSGLLTKLQSVQNAAARFVTMSRKFDHIKPVLHDLHWLHFRRIITFVGHKYWYLETNTVYVVKVGHKVTFVGHNSYKLDINTVQVVQIGCKLTSVGHKWY